MEFFPFSAVEEGGHRSSDSEKSDTDVMVMVTPSIQLTLSVKEE